MKQINQYLGMSRRDNMLVENKRFTIYHRPVRDGMWESQHLEMSRRRLNMRNPLHAERFGERMLQGRSKNLLTCILVHSYTNKHLQIRNFIFNPT
jgi:hypothetical protein